jgi:glycerol-3-phosphate dehydrogenase
VELLDLIIIGGGISGLGLAREASHAGHSTLLLEASRCGEGTSNNTLRIIHGGFRYLQKFDLPRVLRSLNDQSALLNEVPHAVKPLPCLMPLNRFGMKSRLPVTCATMLYGGIMVTQGSPLPAPSVLSHNTIQRDVFLLRDQAPHGALCWHDGLMTDPAAIVSHLKNVIATNGGHIREESPVRAVKKSGAHFTVALSSGEEIDARHVISTLGPALDRIDVPAELKGPRPLWCKGFNVTISRQLDPTYGIAAESSKGRLFFCVPRDSGTAIGTWYVPHPDPATPPSASAHELTEFLAEFNAALPSARVTKDEIVHIDAGILPMHGVTATGPRLIAHERIFERDGYAEVLSTKYTTFRSQARATLAAAKIG